MKKPLPLLLLLFSLTNSVYSTNYYVSNTGNNSNTGLTLPLAWVTLQYAANNVVPGDCVLVANGTYAGCYISASGTSGNPIVFKALGSSATINQPNATTNDGINVEGCDWIVIDGFRVINQPRTGIRVVLADNCVVRNNFCDNNSRWGILTGFAENIIIEYNECSNSQIEHGIYFSNSADNPIIRYNKSHHNNACGIHMNGDISLGGDGIISNARVEGNIIYENGTNGGSGINCDGVQNSLFMNNLLYNNHASGISLYMIDGGAGAKNNKVYNNTIINASNARWCVNIADGSTGNAVFNNILINLHPTRGSITIDAASLSGFTSNNNIVANRFSNDGDNTTITLAQWQAAGGYDSNSVLAATQTSIFVNPTAFDYHLLTGSQAINAGSSSVSVSVINDLDLNIRPQGSGYDIGCYEFLQTNVISEMDLNASVSIFPNPFSTSAVLRITNYSGLRIADIKLFDVVGKKIHPEIIRNSDSFVISSGELPNGIYFLKIGNTTKKIVVNK
ncbi:MAG: T9SS type A sorting domain-containing protein [Bacteroidetes bacterium]|nr:MAG: T9SS type A sorting domain-containing protein [Bacteroidota bacterium]